MSYAGSIVAFPAFRSAPDVYFTRRELHHILNIYGHMVAAGRLRDYAIAETRSKVTFAFFSRASDRPAYRIVKDPRRAPRQGAFYILGPQGQVLKRGDSLPAVLRFFRPKLLRLVSA